MAYSPTLGRWTQPDPAGYVDGLDLYDDERSNPVDGLDPSGLALVYEGMNTREGFGQGPNDVVIDDSGLGNFLAKYARESFGKDYIGGHQWGGTGLPTDPWAVPWNQTMRDTRMIMPCLWKAKHRYEVNYTFSARADSASIEGSARSVLRFPDRIARLEQLVAEFNAMTKPHEQKHVDNMRSSFAPIDAVGWGPTASAADAMAKVNFEVQKVLRITMYQAKKFLIDHDGNRERGVELLNDIQSLVHNTD